MKLNLGCGSDIIEGYLNIDIRPKNEKVRVGDFRNLTVLGIQNDSVEDILATNVLMYLKPSELEKTLTHWAEKLQKGGSLYIQSFDSKVMGDMMATNYETMEVLNALIYGPAGEPPYYGIYNQPWVEAILRKLGLFIVHKSIVGPTFAIKAEKR